MCVQYQRNFPYFFSLKKYLNWILFSSPSPLVPNKFRCSGNLCKKSLEITNSLFVVAYLETFVEIIFLAAQKKQNFHFCHNFEK